MYECQKLLFQLFSIHLSVTCASLTIGALNACLHILVSKISFDFVDQFIVLTKSTNDYNYATVEINLMFLLMLNIDSVNYWIRCVQVCELLYVGAVVNYDCICRVHKVPIIFFFNHRNWHS